MKIFIKNVKLSGSELKILNYVTNFADPKN